MEKEDHPSLVPVLSLFFTKALMQYIDVYPTIAPIGNLKHSESTKAGWAR